MYGARDGGGSITGEGEGEGGGVIRTGHGPPPICHWKGGRLGECWVVSCVHCPALPSSPS